MKLSLWFFFLRETEYMELELRSVKRQGGHKTGGRAQGEGARPPPSWTGCGPPDADFLPVFFINSKTCLRGFSGHSKNFYFCTKITPWLFCWKQHQSGLVSFKSCKLESKTRGKGYDSIGSFCLIICKLFSLCSMGLGIPITTLFSCDGEWINTRPENNPLSMEDTDYLLSFHERPRHTKMIFIWSF